MSNPIEQLSQAMSEAFLDEDPRADEKTIESRNLACLQNLYRAIGQRDFDAVRSCLTPDTTFRIIGAHPFPSTETSGVDAVADEIQRNFAMLRPSEIRVETLVAQGNLLLVIARDRGTMVATGESYDQLFLMELQFRDGLVARAREWLLPSGAGPHESF